MTPLEKLSEIEARVKAATPGPWRWMNRHVLVGDHGKRPVVLASQSRMEILHKDSGLLVENTPSWADPTLIAHAPTDLTRLCKALRLAIEAFVCVENYSIGTPSETEREHKTCGACEACAALAEIARILEGKK